jgi:hypothetical protein
MFEALSRAALLNPDPPEPGTSCSLMPIHLPRDVHAVWGEKWADGCWLLVVRVVWQVRRRGMTSSSSTRAP